MANGRYVLGLVKKAAGMTVTIVRTNIAHSGIFLYDTLNNIAYIKNTDQP